MKAVEAAPDDLVVLVTNTGSAVSIADTPLLGWFIDETGATEARPATLDTLTETWAHIVVTPPATPELIGAARVDVYEPSGWNGSFTAFLDHLAETTGKPVNGSKLAAGALVHRFGLWVGDRLLPLLTRRAG